MKEACELSKQLLALGGMGHTLSIHSQDQEVIMRFALEKPASRIVVNTPSCLGAIGGTTGLVPSLTLGCGTLGGNSTSDNVGPMNLINIKRLAYETISPEDLQRQLFSNEINSHKNEEIVEKIVTEILKKISKC